MQRKIKLQKIKCENIKSLGKREDTRSYRGLVEKEKTQTPLPKNYY